MSRRKKIAVIAGASVAGLAIAAFLAFLIVSRTAWFHGYVEQKVIAALADATGGRAEIGSYTIDWRRLRVVFHDLVIHGNEPAGAAPLVRAPLVQADLSWASLAHGSVGLSALLADAPQGNVMVYPDGSTNIPSPKVKQSNTNTFQTIADVSIGHLELKNGTLLFAGRKVPLEARGENVRAVLRSNGGPETRGELFITPLHLRYGNNVPIDIDVNVPVVLAHDNIRVNGARIATAESALTVSAAMDHLAEPRAKAHVSGNIAVAEVKRAAGRAAPLHITGNTPRVLNVDSTVTVEGERIDVQNARLSLGNSNIEASGVLKNPGQPAGLRFDATLALGQVGALLGLSARPEGVVRAGGTAAVTSASDYRVQANVVAKSLAFTEGSTRLTGIDLSSTVTAVPNHVQLSGTRVSGLGGTFAGNADVRNLAQFDVNGRLEHFDLQKLAAVLAKKPLPYEGFVSGPVQIAGDLRNPSATDVRASLEIAAPRVRKPVSGRLSLRYRAGALELGPSVLQLPHSRVDLTGTMGRTMQVRVVSRDLGDFTPLVALPLSLQRGGSAVFNGTLTGPLTKPHVAGRLQMTNFAVEGRPFNVMSAYLDVSPSRAVVRDGTLARVPLQASFSGSVGMRDFKIGPREPLSVSAAIRNADVTDVLALAGERDVPVTGRMAATARITGTVGDPRGELVANAVNGTIWQQPYDALTARVDLTDRAINLPSLTLTAGAASLTASGSYMHAAGDLKRGVVSVRVASNNVQLAALQGLVKNRPGLAGSADINAAITASVYPSGGKEQFLPTAVNGSAAVRNLQMEGKRLGDLTATAQTSGGAVNYSLNSDFAGSTIRVNGRTLLAGNHETNASAAISRLPVEQALAVAGRRDIRAAGMLDADARLWGTLADPHAAAKLNVANPSYGNFKIDRVQGAVEYSTRLLAVSQLLATKASARVQASGWLAHPPGDYQDGTLQFSVNTNRIQLAQLEGLPLLRPGMGGTVEVAARGGATLRRGAMPLFSTLDANLMATNLSADRQPLGSVSATAETRGAELLFNLKSDLLRSDIRGNGRMLLRADYPLSAQLSFQHVTYSALAPLLAAARNRRFDAAADGQVAVSGPAARPDHLKGTLQVSRFELFSVQAPNAPQIRNPIQLHNAGPIVVALDRSTLRVASAHLTGSYTDLTLTGTAGLKPPYPLGLQTNGNVRLGILEALSPNVVSSGELALNVAVQGTAGDPSVNGRVDLHKASLNLLSLPNGLSNANGAIVFSGRQATIESITGVVGGGKVELAGTVGFGAPGPQFRLQATGRKVRIEVPPNFSTSVDADLALSGASAKSLLSGKVTILDAAFHYHTDIGSLLSQAGAPQTVPRANTGMLANMRLDVRIETAPDVQFRTTLAENIQATANLSLRGTAAQPGMLGRMDVTEGQIIFFGNTYKVQQGALAFYDPHRINPDVNIDLATTVKGVDVDLTVAGPMDRMKLSYRSSPPMTFNEVLSLLTGGNVTTDPVLAAREPVAPQQSYQQMGASALLGQAVANPVAGRLQRLFGVSRLSIAPQIIGVQNTPRAVLTLEQNVSKDITFTYIQDVSQANPQVLRVEWAIDPKWSAVLERDINGESGIDFYYKKRLK